MTLVTKGYFPEEILPPFHTEDLKLVIDHILTNLDILDPITGKKKIVSKPVTFSIPKIKIYRRNLSIPNPLHYIRLSNTIVQNWNQIQAHCDKSNISLSRLNIIPGTARALIKPNFNDTAREKIIRSTGYRYLLKIDIAKCYNSIYTHSIPWALHTKVSSKAARSRKSFFGNELDEDSRKLQDGQTVGIPIGPDCSRIISEIILSSIDLEIKKQIGNYSGVRVIDDYHLYFKSQGDLDLARSIISKSLKEYELELNQSKEKTLELPELIESEWFDNLRNYRFRNKGYQRKDLIAFFDLALLYTKKFPDDLVMTYAMSKLRATVFSPKNWEILQSLMLNALIIESKILPYVAQNLTSYHNKEYKLNYLLIQNALEEFIVFHLRLNNDFEVAWTLWILKSLKIVVSENLGENISESKNPIVILTALDLFHSGFMPKGLVIANWKQYLTQENLYSEFWLIAYEAKMKGWIPTPTDYIDKDPFFKILKDNGVSFYNEIRTQDLSKVKVNSTDFYFDDKEEGIENTEEEHDSVFNSITPIIIEKSENPDDDIPF